MKRKQIYGIAVFALTACLCAGCAANDTAEISAPNADEPTLNQTAADDIQDDPLLDSAQRHLDELVDEPERYTLTRFERSDDNTKLYATWNAFSGEVPTMDSVSITMDKNGALTEHALYHTGEFRDVTATMAQAERAVEIAAENAAAGENVRLKRIQEPKDIVLTHDKKGAVSFQVGVTVEYLVDDPLMTEQGVDAISSADFVYIPLAECG